MILKRCLYTCRHVCDVTVPAVPPLRPAQMEHVQNTVPARSEAVLSVQDVPDSVTNVPLVLGGVFRLIS